LEQTTLFHLHESSILEKTRIDPRIDGRARPCYEVRMPADQSLSGNKVIAIRLLAFALVAFGHIAPAQGGSTPRDKEGRRRRQVVFVCEHGAALSVVSAAYFNKLAREQHLNVHAVARGKAPQQDISTSAAKGLKSDGVPSETRRPQALSEKDAARALRIVAFCPVPERYSRLATVETWNDVPPTAVNYPAARDAILRHLKELMTVLSQTENTQP
jgi:hypothetical protein